MRPTGPGQPAHLLLDVVDILNELSISYAMVGAFAVSYYGLPRYTSDADAAIWLKGTGITAQELTNRLRTAGYRPELKRADSRFSRILDGCALSGLPGPRQSRAKRIRWTVRAVYDLTLGHT